MATSGEADYLIVAGPTASGKSALALALAEALDGVIINADSMQVYAGLSVITAAPSAADVERVPHHLFGHVDAGFCYSQAMWLDEVNRTISACRNHLPILVGGTGFYLKAALEGIVPVPSVAAASRARARTMLETLGGDAMRAELARHDPELAAAIKAGDSQRLMRAMEVWIETGVPLGEWQKGERQGGLSGRGFVVYLRPPRPRLYERIDCRFGAMLEAGAWDEAKRLAARDLSPDLPAMKALGVKPLIDALAGRITAEEASQRSQRDSRRYAKRQYTWFDHQLASDLRLEVMPDSITDSGNQAKTAQEVLAHLSNF